MNNIGIYVHIPFCKSKCGYCDFYSGCDLSKAERYINALLLQFDALKDLISNRSVDTVYIGGGTPTAIGDDLLIRVIDRLYDRFAISDEVEFTIEANPGTVDENALRRYRASGVNRISFGVQSANDALLRRIGRIHTFAEARDAIISAHRAGFDNISADLMYALPDQTKNDLIHSIELLSDLPITHLSMYGLKVEENTPFGRDRSLVLPDEDEQCEMYLDGVQTLANKGFYQYEISNFAKQGRESKHNLKYWKCEEYLGFGVAAHSFIAGARFYIPRCIDQFCAESHLPFPSSLYCIESLSDRDRLEELILLSLRTTSGIRLTTLFSILSEKKRAAAEKYLQALIGADLGRSANGSFSLTPSGMLLSNSIISDLLLYLDE